MKVTIVNHSDIVGGASIVSLRLLHALREQEVDARMIVRQAKGYADEHVTAIGRGLADKSAFLGERLKIFLSNGFNRRLLFKVSTADRGLPVASHPWIIDADIVLLSWFNQGMMSLDEIRKISALGKPIVWTMHDMWAMTGICHHSGGCDRYRTLCGECPYLGERRKHDLSTTVFEIKRRLYNDLTINFVAVSHWLAGRANQSALLHNQKVVVINNALPIERYQTVPRHSRTELGLPDDRNKLVAMCAARLDDTIKDLPTAIAALNQCDGYNVTAVFCGNIREPKLLDGLKIPYVYLGNISDADKMADIYAHCSAVISSSKFESLPSTLIEGMAAGAVPIGFGGDGRDEIIDHLSNGYLARNGEPSDFAAGIKWALEAGLSREGLHRGAAERYSSQKIAQQYIDLFKRILK